MNLAVIGTGLIGASVGLAAKCGGATVVGFDADQGIAKLAAEHGAVDDPDLEVDEQADRRLAGDEAGAHRAGRGDDADHLERHHRRTPRRIPVGSVHRPHLGHRGQLLAQRERVEIAQVVVGL